MQTTDILHQPTPNELYKLGKRYLDGHGVEKDLKKAHRLLELAAEQGDVHMRTDVGATFIDHDDARALHWLGRALQDPTADVYTIMSIIQDIFVSADSAIVKPRNDSLVQIFGRAIAGGMQRHLQAPTIVDAVEHTSVAAPAPTV